MRSESGVVPGSFGWTVAPKASIHAEKQRNALINGLVGSLGDGALSETVACVDGPGHRPLTIILYFRM